MQRTCPHCAAPFDYAPFVVDTLVRHGVLPDGQRPKLVRGSGCARCRGTGMLGRVAACGLLVVSDGVRDAIGRRASLGELRAVAARGAHIELTRYAGRLRRPRRVQAIHGVERLVIPAAPCSSTGLGDRRSPAPPA